MIFNESGGTSLNFKVIGGITEPSNPKENTIWVNTGTEITSWDFSATEPNKRSKNKNMIVYPFIDTTKTTNGITFTDNKNGTITANGTATADAYFRCSVEDDPSEIVATPGTYILSGCPSGGGNGTYHIFAGDGNLGIYPTDYGTGAVRTLSSGGKFNVFIRIKKGTTVSNLVFKPQLEKGSAPTTFAKGDATGQVWIHTGSSGTGSFNALKKNGITVSPILAEQFASGAWVEKTAKSYQNGEWVDWWSGELYKDGKLYNVLADGFETVGSTVVNYEDGYFIYYNPSATGVIASPQMIDTTGYKTVKITGGLTYQSSSINVFKAGLATEKNTTSFVSSVQFPNNVTGNTISIQIPSDGGKYYLVLTCGGSTSTTNCVKITKIIME